MRALGAVQKLVELSGRPKYKLHAFLYHPQFCIPLS